MDIEDVMYPVPFETSDGKRYLVDWRDAMEVFQRDPGAITLPPEDLNELTLTADDCVWLWSQGIGF
jgi:hypothetical protein